MKTAILATAFSAALAMLPIQVQAAIDEVGGLGTVTDVPVSDNILWTTLKTVTHTVNGGAGVNDCMVVASADLVFPNNDSGNIEEYVFTITRNDNGNGNPALAENGNAERTVGFVDNVGVEDIFKKSVSTNTRFSGLTSTNGTAGTNQHTFYLLGKKRNSTSPAPDLTVEDSRIDFVCVDRD